MAESEDKTEAATSRRLERARESGDTPLSREATTFAVLAAGALVLTMVLPPALRSTASRLAVLFEQAHAIPPLAAVALAAGAAVRLAAPFALAALLLGGLAVLLQTRFLVNLDALRPDLSRLDPRRGLRRIAGPETLLETGKSVLKMVLVGWVVWHGVSAVIRDLPTAVNWHPAGLLEGLRSQIVALLLSVLAAQGAIAMLDILRARLKHARSLRMSREEVREEHRESEGDPRIKARRRALQRQRARRRMLAAVPKATVVVTNPTHYAVALAYDRSGAAAPRVVAKGVDALAARIRAVAEESRVPLIANPPLARALHTVPLDAEIPAEHYKAVAEIIAYVWRLRSARPAIAA